MAKINLLSWYNNLSPRERKVSYIATGFILILLIDLTVVTPLWDSYLGLSEEITAAEGNLMRNMANLKKKEAVEADYAKYKSMVVPSGPDEEENAHLLSAVEVLARSNQVVLIDMKPSEVKTMTFHKEFGAELDAESDIKNLVGFIYQLETSSQLMRVSMANLSSKDPKSPVVRAKLTITKTAFVGGT